MPYSDDCKRETSKDARQTAYQTIKNNILELLLPPGAKLNEAEMSATLCMSRTPVRDVFARLTREGLVEQIPQRGAFVTRINPARVEQESWLLIQSGAAVIEALFVEQISRSDFLLLQHLVSQMQLSLARQDFLQTALHLTAFHAGMYRLAGLELAWEALQSATGDYQRVIRLVDRVPNAWDGLLLECQGMADSLSERSPAAAERALRHQAARISEIALLVQPFYPDFFSDSNPTQL